MFKFLECDIEIKSHRLYMGPEEVMAELQLTEEELRDEIKDGKFPPFRMFTYAVWDRPLIEKIKKERSRN